jgi:hypothetical protein
MEFPFGIVLVLRYEACGVFLTRRVASGNVERMTRKPIILIGGPMAVCALALGMVAILLPRPGISKANFDRIENEMTVEQVDQILGELSSEPGFDRPRDPRKWAYWNANDGSSIGIGLLHGRVAGKEWNYSDEPMMKRMLRWIGVR